MPFTTGYTKTLTVDGVAYQQTVTGSSDGKEEQKPSVPAAKVGVLTTRTDADTGTCTMASGHGFVTSDKVDVFWNGGSRRNLTATVTGDSAVLDGGSGDVLPAAATAITAMKPVERPFTVDGDTVDALTVKCPVSGWVVIRDSLDAVLAAYQIPPNLGGAKVWAAGGGEANPLAGVVADHVLFSHGDSAQAQTMEAVALS